MQQFINIKLNSAFIIMCVLSLIILQGCNRETSPEAISRGQTALKNGKYQEAIKHLKRAAELNKNSDIVYYNLGMAYLNNHEYKLAATAFEKSEKLCVDGSTHALEGLANAHRQMNEYEKAQNAIRRAFGKVNRKAHLVAANAACEMGQGNFANAEKLLSEALITDPKDPVALFNMAVFKKKPQINKPPKAVNFYIKFLMLTAKTEFSKEREIAIEAIRAINVARPGDVEVAIDQRMVDAASTKDPISAAILIAEAYDIDRSNPDILWSLIRKLEEAGKKREARAWQRIFSEVFPYDERSAIQ
ncbi:MAG: tetratricopeptide repeat protein [Lentisphaerae bacterium]|nr:tetratricopeptide repeat protein [Lentisphaerota bacterium]